MPEQSKKWTSSYFEAISLYLLLVASISAVYLRGQPDGVSALVACRYTGRGSGTENGPCFHMNKRMRVSSPIRPLIEAFIGCGKNSLQYDLRFTAFLVNESCHMLHIACYAICLFLDFRKILPKSQKWGEGSIRPAKCRPENDDRNTGQ